MMEGIRRPASLALLAPLLLATACARGRNDSAEPAERAGPAQAEAGPAENDRPPFLSPRGGPPGTVVTVSMSGLVINARVEVGFGSFVEHQIVHRGQNGPDGTFSVALPIPITARPGAHYFFLAEEDGSPFAISNPFLVTARDGSIRLRGKVTTEGVACTAMRGAGDELYTLVGDLGSPAPGVRVTVEGTIAQTSTCRQGLTILVSKIQVDP